MAGLVLSRPDQEEKVPREWRQVVPVAVVAGILAIAVMLFLWWQDDRRMVTPATGSPEAGFARDMAMHHAQAVDMATLLRERSEDAEVRQLALDIMLTQQAQIGQMQGWLAVWGLPIASVEPAMDWMGMPVTGRMPGMASPEELNRLRSLNGPEAEELFLHLMIPHHQAGVDMAQAILERTEQAPVVALAQSIVNSQQTEITYMEELLQRKGFAPVPDAPAMNHEEMGH